MTRKEALNNIALTIEKLINAHGRRHDIFVTFCASDEEPDKYCSDWDRKFHGILPGDEYFMIYEHDANDMEEPYHLLYTVNVSYDSPLTAASELMDLVSRKF